jgi:tetratricopeptide (TPR) repeat protein
VAAAFVAKKDVYAVSRRIDAWVIGVDPTPRMNAALRRAGKLDDAEIDRRRTEWIEGWRKTAPPDIVPHLWIYGYANTVETPAQAKQALEALPGFGALPVQRPIDIADAQIGRTYLLAGRVDEALPILRRAAGQCAPFENPFAWVRASLWLGQALEAKGQRDEACAAYKSVTTRWKSYSKSVTVKEAAARAHALACP